MALNVTTAAIASGANTAIAQPSLAQWDQGQILKIEGVELPESYQVEFSGGGTVRTVPMIGTAEGVQIPNKLLQSSHPITAHVVLHESATDRETEYWITIYVKPRQAPETVEIDPADISIIDQTIAAAQQAVATSTAQAEAAAGSAESAAASAEAATASETAAAGSASSAASSERSAGASAVEAGQAKTAAETAQGAAEAAQAAAEQAVTDAQAAGSQAVEAIDEAKTAGIQAIDAEAATQINQVGRAGATQIRQINELASNQMRSIETKTTQSIGAIEDARDAAIEDVQTEGQTQTAAAQAQAQAAASSASAAANSASAAAGSASAAATARTGAETAAASVSASAAQIAQNASDIADLNRQLSDLENGGNVELPVTYTNGGYIQDYLPGNVVEYAGWKYSDYIDISGHGGKIYCTMLTAGGTPTTDGNLYNAFYNANKVYISSFSTLNGEVVVPENAVYARISCRVAYTQTIAIYEEGIFVKIENNKNIDNEYFQIATWNVGIFKDGTNKPTTEEAAAQIVKLRKTVGEVNADVLNAQEYVDYVDVSNTISSANLLAFKYANKTNAGSNKCFSKYPIESAETITFTSGSRRLCRAFTINFHGKTITIINYHAAIDLDPSVYREADAVQLIEYMQSKEYCILTGDFNAASDSEFNQFTEAGYTLCNGGILGWFNTWPVMANMPDGWSSSWPCNHLDNIIVSSNIVPQFVEVIESMISDHAPLHVVLRID